MEGLIKPFKKVREDYCPKCGHQRCLELYSVYDKPLRYSNLLDFGKDSDIDSVYNNVILSYIKCKNCNYKFKLLWDKNKLRPAYDDSYAQFMSRFLRNEVNKVE